MKPTKDDYTVMRLIYLTCAHNENKFKNMRSLWGLDSSHMLALRFVVILVLWNDKGICEDNCCYDGEFACCRAEDEKYH